MNKSKIILLNGVSSSGKSTLGLALQDTLPDKYFLFSQDGFSEIWPYKYWKDDPDGIYIEAMKYMNQTIRMMAASGAHIIIDHLFLDNYTGIAVLQDCIACFSDLPVLFVRVDCNPDELDRRERWRGDRELGLAHRQLKELYPKHTYDIVVDTSAQSTFACALDITKAAEQITGDAFTSMRSRMNEGQPLE